VTSRALLRIDKTECFSGRKTDGRSKSINFDSSSNNAPAFWRSAGFLPLAKSAIDPPHFDNVVVAVFWPGISKLASSIFGKLYGPGRFLALSALAKTAPERTVGVEYS
jgi:hypothetical protein